MNKARKTLKEITCREITRYIQEEAIRNNLDPEFTGVFIGPKFISIEEIYGKCIEEDEVYDKLTEIYNDIVKKKAIDILVQFIKQVVSDGEVHVELDNFLKKIQSH